MKDWISVKELSEIQGITPRAVRKAVSKNKYITRQANGTKGIKYEIFVPSLSEDVQNIIDFEKKKSEIEKADLVQRVTGLRQANRNSFNAQNQANGEQVASNLRIIPDKAKQIALARYDLVNL